MASDLRECFRTGVRSWYIERAGIADTTPAHSPNLDKRSELMSQRTSAATFLREGRR